MRNAAKRLHEVKATLLEMIDRVRDDPAALESRGDVESFLDELEQLARSIEDAPKKQPSRDVVRAKPVSFARVLGRDSAESDNLAFIERTLGEALSASPGEVDLKQVLDELWQEMRQLDMGMLSGQALGADRVVEAYARLNPWAQRIVERFFQVDRRRARTWYRNLLFRPKRLDLGSIEDELRNS